MGVSFKVSRTGKRFKPKPSLQLDSDVVEDDNGGDGSRIAREDEAMARKLPGSVAEGAGKDAVMSGSFMSTDLAEREVSFTVNIFRDGYSIGKPSENDMVHQSAIQDVPKMLHPYDRASETMFSDIESGLLPCDILDEIPCKFTDGTLVCEVRDYRKCASEPGSVSLTDRSPIVNKVCLRMTLENLVKDIPMISDNSWAYGDVIELESMVLKAMQPRLLLEPTPKLDRLCKNPAPRLQLGLGLGSMRRKRLRQMPEVTVTCNGKIHGKKVCIDRVTEGSNGRLGDSGIVPEHAPENLANNMVALRANGFVQDASLMAQHLANNQANYQMGINNNPRISQDHVSTSQDLMNSFVSKRENSDGPMSPLSSLNNKRARPMPVGLEGPMGQHMDNVRSDSNWKSTLLQPPAMGRGIQYANTGNQKFSQQVFDGVLNQDVRYAKEEQLETANKLEGSDMQMVESEAGHNDPQQPKHQQRLPQNTFMRSNFPQTPWNNLGQHTEKDGRKEEQLPRRKPVQSPRVSAGTLVHSPLSSKSGEFSTGSAGPHFGTQKEKAAISGPMSTNDVMQRQHQAQHPPVKRRSNSANKNPSIAAVGSPASVSNVASPSLGTQSVDKDVLERFSKIEMVVLRHQLNRKKNKGDEYIRKPKVHAAHMVGESLSRPDNNEDDKEVEKPLSKSVGGGSMNVCKTRVMTLVHQERVLQGNSVTYVPKFRSRMIMSEKPGDGTVAMLYGDVEQGDFHSVEDHLLTLPNTHFADLLAKQFITLVEHEGYTVQRHVEIRQPRINTAAAIQPNNPGMEMQQYGEAVPNQASNDGAKPTNGSSPSFNSSQNPLANSRMLPPGTSQALQISQGLLNGVSMPPRQHLPDSQPSLSQHQQQQNQLAQQQQHSQFQRSMMLAANPLANLNAIGQNNPSMQLGNHMVNKQSALQLQLFNQQQQQQQQNQQQPQLHRKMMMGLGNMGNNMGGIPSLGNTMTMGNARGVGGTGISAPIPGMGNIAQNPMNMNNSASNIGNAISQHIRSGTLAPAVIMASKLRNMHTTRATMLGGPQQSIAGIPGSRQLHPNTAGLSVLGHTLNRANNMGPMQRASMGPMAPPKLMGGMNMYMNPQQQQQQLQQQQQQQQQHLQQQQQLQLQQLQQQHQQDSGSSPQVGSPSAMGMQQMTQQQAQLQQQASPQQMAQRTPMSPQMSAGAVHAMSAGNPEGCPASPQLSSQTLGSVANSPMELQGVNKSN